jgi:hypothetical protein
VRHSAEKIYRLVTRTSTSEANPNAADDTLWDRAEAKHDDGPIVSGPLPASESLTAVPRPFWAVPGRFSSEEQCRQQTSRRRDMCRVNP